MSKLSPSKISNYIQTLALKLLDPKRIPELSGERVVFHYLKSTGFLSDCMGKRILEIGPKHGKDSRLLASLNPTELVLLDLPEKRPMIEHWFPDLQCNKTYIQGNILYLTEEEMLRLGQFDLIWCLGVIYHNAEQLRLIKKLYNLCCENGKIVIESATTRNKKLEKLNVVEIHWPETYRKGPTITHLPSRLALKSWLEMSGFGQVNICHVYSKQLSVNRAVLTGVKGAESEPYLYYQSVLNPNYAVGAAE
jgi:2-polyprenyl-3-methyl-5-hydroxy-6-metoxy-1,4-benzoquinol methylase